MTQGSQRRHRPSYLVQKERKKLLRTQLQELQRQLAQLQARPRSIRSQILDSLAANSTLRDTIQFQQLALAEARSMLAGMQERQVGSPLRRHIHLPREAWDRRQVLQHLKAGMITRGCEYIRARSQHLDLMKPQLMDHRYEDANGNFCCERFEFFHFTGVQSMRQVFEAIKYFMLNMEITISEALGHTTVREDYDAVDAKTSLWNYRLLSTDTHGVTSEVNKVALTEYFDELFEMEGKPCAVVLTDCVDVDDMYPYNPHERVRRDICATTLLTEVRRSKCSGKSLKAIERQDNSCVPDANFAPRARDEQSSDDEEELVIVMQRVALLTLHRPAFPITKSALRSLKEGIASWGEIEVQSIRRAVEA
ncbi:hypothetical protein CCR75_002498 [Bremia lactucae]|uniref:Uncharacterized protein n=1 Tax=Bremia lactucae TaxID=4779 RepID=A0A976IGF6_BRELC|nr:hypothetical protein CCR75_002498 [Bremia lactucae]